MQDISEDELANEKIGFKESVIWNTLYNFQKDAVWRIINKLEKYNGSILADSVGLGKTFTVLAKDRFNYKVLFHTDLSRTREMSGSTDLSRINWGNFDLVVIDESHNFRNNSARNDREIRYTKL